LDVSLKEVFIQKTVSIIKRGCSEYPLKFPEYGKIGANSKDMMRYPKEWKSIEEKFDKNYQLVPKQTTKPSLSGFCLSDFYIIQKWIDYAKGIGDNTSKIFNDRRNR